jgi:HD-GYP domain-containing protein (c-di-GMP phosphodiesterase class II)
MIIATCDAYHAMTSDRSYRRGMGHDAAIVELRANSGTQFDPAVVDSLIAELG